MDLLSDTPSNKIVLVLMKENQYEKKLALVVKNLGTENYVCYVCLSRPYTSIVSYLEERGINIGKFVFIDVLASHYQTPAPSPNCIYLKSPDKLEDIQEAISKCVQERSCKAIIFDTISSLLMYQQNFEVIKFTHQITTEEMHQDINKIFLVLKESKMLDNYSDSFIKDLQMFANKTLEI